LRRSSRGKEKRGVSNSPETPGTGTNRVKKNLKSRKVRASKLPPAKGEKKKRIVRGKSGGRIKVQNGLSPSYTKATTCTVREGTKGHRLVFKESCQDLGGKKADATALTHVGVPPVQKRTLQPKLRLNFQLGGVGGGCETVDRCPTLGGEKRSLKGKFRGGRGGRGTKPP